ncbi:glycoside hydrolase family 18 protein [Alloacidobacterium dinghuense]|uniref:chitinase n=1 Tax=Alloacidobacterium dinghuense TaxID=2763107 RepID=A0A7G8BEC1_9BACT|nr:glycoside hydrolase family 18 protein [Alloacidobacterium dinghuense]QNI30891.1 glycoside hydrolase family 18 protein [Alloacidobacterium dinghuense]
MSTRVSVCLPNRAFTFVLASLLVPFFLARPSLANEPRHDNQSKVVGGYFEEWSIYFAGYNIANLQANGVADRLTHLTYAFGDATPTGCAIADSWADYQDPSLPSVSGATYTGPLYGNFAALQQLKQLHPNLKVLISLAGADGFSAAASTAAGRQAMVSNCIDLFVKGNLATGISAAGVFDGIDIDWEFPSAADTVNATLLLQEFRKQLDALGKANHKHYLLTMFGPAGQQNFSNIQLAEVARQLDFFNVQGYDFHGTWETSTNHASPLFDDKQDPDSSENFYIDYTIRSYLQAGVPGEKLVLGIPTYARGWTGVPSTGHGLYQTSTGPAPFPSSDYLQTPGVITYLTLTGLTGYTRHYDYRRIAVWLYDPGTQTFWSYDDPVTVWLKTAYVRTRVRGGLGGAFVWALKDDDANGTIVKTMAAGLN